MKVYFKRVNTEIQNPIPEYKTEGSAGMDIASASLKDIIIHPGETKLIPSNFILEIPKGYEGQVRPRSGLALKNTVTVLNSPGTIDSDYRGEVKVLLINHGKKDFTVKFGDRIAQLIISKCEQAELILSKNLSDTERGSGGYGSTGK
ncbi:MAG: dUTP diphosphatase [Ignavibacteria bacterium]|nr:dUTP diphosphatase [Bacteroidota bacterium]MBL7128294.1 dUTP diphosphatase [Ignavibacteria bacterium]